MARQTAEGRVQYASGLRVLRLSVWGLSFQTTQVPFCRPGVGVKG